MHASAKDKTGNLTSILERIWGESICACVYVHVCVCVCVYICTELFISKFSHVKYITVYLQESTLIHLHHEKKNHKNGYVCGQSMFI